MTAAVIVAAGRGVRLGGALPKALRLLNGQPMFAYSVREALACPAIQRVVVVVPALHVKELAATLDETTGRVRFVAGGSSRQQSVLSGIEAAGAEAEWVAVHDAARPLVTGALFGAVIALAQQHGGALAAHPATDTIRRRETDGTLTTLPRAELWHAETPQVFRAAELAQALVLCEREGFQVTDEAEAMQRGGSAIALYHNSAPNHKISTEADWRLVEDLLRNLPVPPG